MGEEGTEQVEASALGAWPEPKCKGASWLPMLMLRWCKTPSSCSPGLAPSGRAWLPRWRWWRGQKQGEGEQGRRKKKQGSSCMGCFILLIQPTFLCPMVVFSNSGSLFMKAGFPREEDSPHLLCSLLVWPVLPGHNRERAKSSRGV